MKTETKAKDKTDKKVAKADKKTGKKCGALLAFLALAATLVTGCAQTGSQPSRSQTLNNEFRDCIVVVAAHAAVTNTTVVANSEDGLQPIELFTQTMKNEGSESNAPTASPTQTTRIDPKTDVNTTGGRTAGVLESLIGSFGAWLTTDSGKTAASEAAKAACADGSCTTGNCTTGNCATGNCSEGACTDGSCTVK